MKPSRHVATGLLALLAGAGCVTINLYFPVTELEEAASEVVADIRSEPSEEAPLAPEDPAEPGAAEPRPPGASPGGVAEPETPRGEARQAPSRPEAARGFLALEPRAAHAASPDEAGGKEAGEGGKAGIKIDVSTPVIKRIREALKKRYPKLVPFFEKGALGEGLDGYVALRGSDGLALKEKRDLQALVEEENADRKNLYTEIARANGIEAARIPDIGLLFSRQWQKTSKTGWWIETEKGKWIRKPEEKKKKKG
jgi:uncharacterized protein YdbL (DUF1318 family)